MTFPLDQDSTSPASSHAALVGPDTEIRWSELRDRVSATRACLPSLSGKRVALPLAASCAGLVTLIAAATADCHLFLVGADTPDDTLRRWRERFHWDEILASDRDLNRDPSVRSQSDFAPSDAARWATSPVTILTSGTSGEPKAVAHTWQSLSRPVRRNLPEGARWLLTFRPHLYAGLQVILQSLLNRGTLVVPAQASPANQIVALARTSAVEFASATPSYWRWLMTTADHRELQQIPLRQITLGGEAVDQPTLDGLRRLFPSTRLVHIYATTELGRCFSVSDGQAGFPSQWLEQASVDGVEMQVDDGELIVRSANAMQGYDGPQTPSLPDCEHLYTSESPNFLPWFRTGDLVQVIGDRVYFVGRRSDMINVGGNKVYPLEIERLIRQVPGVADVRIYGQPSSLVGQLVACDWVLESDGDPVAVEQAIRQIVVEHLPTYQRPRMLQRVPEIPRTSAGKTRRESG